MANEPAEEPSPATAPETFGVTVRDWNGEATAQQLGERVGGYTYYLSRYIDLSNLDGLTLAVRGRRQGGHRRPRYVDPWSTPSLDARRPTGSRTMPQRYDIREDREGWTVFDLFTGEPVVISDVPQTGLDIQDADELAELLDHKAFANNRTLRQ